MFRPLFAVITLLLFIALTTVATAHSHLKASDPAANATLAASPGAIRLTFSTAVEPSFSTIQVTDASGKTVTAAKAEPDPKNPKLLVLPLAEQLAPGEYRVTWHAVAGDSHPMDGSYVFWIKQ